MAGAVPAITAEADAMVVVTAVKSRFERVNAYTLRLFRIAMGFFDLSDHARVHAERAPQLSCTQTRGETFRMRNQLTVAVTDKEKQHLGASARGAVRKVRGGLMGHSWARRLMEQSRMAARRRGQLTPDYSQTETTRLDWLASDDNKRRHLMTQP